jgi:hypothetical protein
MICRTEAAERAETEPFQELFNHSIQPVVTTGAEFCQMIMQLPGEDLTDLNQGFSPSALFQYAF